MIRTATAAVALLLATAPALAQQRPPAQINVDNRRAAALTELTVSDAQGTVLGRLARPLAGGQRTTLRLTRARSCELAVRAQFDDEGEVDETVNLCRERQLRFTD